MLVYCPTCGQKNESRPEGGRIMCTACTAVFDAPAEVPQGAPVQQQERPAPASLDGIPTGKLAPLSRPGPSAPGTLSKAAIVSLVAGLVCCVPVASPIVAIVSGVMAFSDIRDHQKSGMPLAIVGFTLGILGAIFQVLMLIGTLAGPS